MVDRRGLLIEYLKMKVDEGDWHGVADAAMDLREVEAEHTGFHKGLNYTNKGGINGKEVRA